MNNLDLLRLYFATRLQSRDIRKFKEYDNIFFIIGTVYFITVN